MIVERLKAKLMRSVLYLHGFASGPKSYKKEQVKEIFGTEQVSYPQLSPHPLETVQQISDEIVKLQTDYPENLTVLLGTSMGGFYATFFALYRNLPAFVFNPAYDVSLFKELIGTHQRFTDGSTFTFTREDYNYLYLSAFPMMFELARENPERTSKLFITFNRDDETVSHDLESYKSYFPKAHFEVFEEGGHGFPDLYKSRQLLEIDLTEWA